MDLNRDLYKNLLMEEKSEKQASQYQGSHPYFSNHSGLVCESVETEGECILLSVTPILLNKPLYYLYVFFSILLFGIPFVFVYWQIVNQNRYPKLKLYFYFEESSLSKCTHFVIVNYDHQISYAEKKESEEQQEIAGRAERSENMEEKEEQRQKMKVKFVYFYNRYIKYKVIDNVVKADIFDYQKNLRNFVTRNHQARDIENVMNQTEVYHKRERFGLGTMIIDRPGLSILFLRQIVRPLYFFMVFTLLLWIFQKYYFYCGAIFLTCAVGVVLNLYQTFHNNKKIFEMAYYEIQVNVLRKINESLVEVRQISSKDVVPGDIVFLKDQIKIPFDAIIVEGSILINECALTGQSVPVVKKSETLDDYAGNKFSQKNCVIFEGTTIVQIDGKKKFQIFQEFRKAYGIPVFVIRTNFVTMKGQLIRMISFPIQKTSIFEKQSQKFLVILFCIACFSYILLIFKLKGYVDPIVLVLHFLDLITVTVPPGLPVSMTFGIIYALEKLKKKEIYCISPNKVVLGGLVDFICFDKTGTLTQDYMDFYALVPCHQGVFRDSLKNFIPNAGQGQINVKKPIQKMITQNPYINHSLTNMASNHTIVNIEETGQNVGDPMEVKLFQFGEFKFNDHLIEQESERHSSEVVLCFDSLHGHHGIVIKRFNFDSELFRMSAIAKASYPICDSGLKKDSQNYFVYTKGSPEHMQKIFDKQTVPQEYMEKVNEYASQGLRVLAIGHRCLDQDELHKHRLLIENNLIFDGFEIFQNRLKPETKKAFKDLQNAQIPCIMITGDNALTGCSIAYKCRIANSSRGMKIIDLVDGVITIQEFRYEKQKHEEREEDRVDFDVEQKQVSDKMTEREQIEQKEIQLKLMSKMPQKMSSTGQNRHQVGFQNTTASVNQIISKIHEERTQLCLTGPAFNKLFVGELEDVNEDLKTILAETKVFARTKPNDKARIVMAFQKCLEKITGMCGDGANDCGALKQAEIGLSLSQTEASISAPFTAKIANISSMVELIKQCQAGLITNFCLFNVMALYCLIQYTTTVICQFYFTYPSNGQYTYWDIFGNFLLFMTVGYTATSSKLSSVKPPRSLFSLTNMGQVGIMYILQLLGQILIIYALANIFADDIDYSEYGGSENNYERFLSNDHEFSTVTPEASSLFLFSNFLYLFSFIGFSFSKPWRKGFYTNLPFMIIFVIVLLYSSLIILVPAMRWSFFEIKYIDSSKLNIFIFFMAYLFGIGIYLNQKCILEPLSAKLRNKYNNKNWI